MTPNDLVRKALIGAATLSLGACGMVEGDPHRFENLADRVATIDLTASPSRDAPAAPRAAEQSGLRQALRVEMLDPHALWDARDGGLRGVVEAAAPAVAEAAAPAIVRAASDQVGRALTEHLRPAVSTPARPAAVIQLGAFSSEAAAREAWTRFNAGSARVALEGLSPRFEPVTVNGRDLVRLKVGAPAETAAEICRAAQVSDPWCAAAGRT